MLGKPLSHLRPLLRLQTHAQPDLFTSNPSLLHHFPQQGGHAVVQAGPSSAQAAGQNAGNAGRAGWGGGAGTGGNGYTGHARAFLGIPQTSAVDPSSGLSDDTKDQERATISHQRRFQATRFAQTQVAGTLEGSEGRRRIEGREGGLLRAIAMEDAAEIRSLDPDLAARYIAAASAAAGEMASRPRRGSIAYPKPRPAITSAGEVSLLPGGRRSLTRSSSSMDVGLGSTITSRSQLRSFSSRPSNIPLPELIDESPVDSAESHTSPSHSTSPRTILQPNRILMDLAGRDLPSSSSISRRHNSSLATQPPLQIFDDLPLPALPSTPSPEEELDQARDTKLYNTIVGKTRNRIDPSRSNLASIIAHYRSSRRLAPLDERQEPGNPRLVGTLPLPTGYTVGTYNACLEGLMELRQPGESIARVLEAYNEMLERDVLPNMRTYQIVIRALCAREKDVSLVAQRWEREKQWAQWKSEGMGRSFVADEQQVVRDQLLEGYAAEGNLESALRLFSAARTFQNNSYWRFQPFVYHTLLKTIATQSKPNLGGLREVFNHAVSRHPRGIMGMYGFVFEALGWAGHVEELKERWDGFRKEEHDGHGTLLSHWMDAEQTEGDAPVEVRIKGARMAAYQIAIRHFARLGRMEEAEGIVELVELSAPEDGGFHVADAYAALILGIAARDTEAALAKYAELEPKIKATSLGRLPSTEMFEIADHLILAGHWREAYAMTVPEIPNPKTQLDAHRVQHLYQAIVVAAKRTSSPEEAREILGHIPTLLRNRDFEVHPFPIRDHFAVLEQFKLWSEAEPTLAPFRNARHEVNNWRIWFIPFVQAASPHLNMAELLDLYRSAMDMGIAIGGESTTTTELLADKYVAERAADPAAWAVTLREIKAKGWEVFMIALSKLGGEHSGERYKEGGLDEALEKITEDIVGVLQSSSGGERGELIRARISAKLGPHLRVVLDRFGESRAQAMFQGVEMPSNFAWSQGGEAAAQADASASTPDPTVSEFSLPSPPTSTTSVSPPTPPSGPTYTISHHLSRTIDAHFGRNPRMTAEAAYTRIMDEQLHGVVPYPGTIARLINSLGREGADDKVSNLYALAQTILERSGLDHADLANHWSEVETHMIIASCHLGHLERAGVHRQRIIDAGLVPSADAYATMIASSKDTTDEVLVARALFDESQQLGVAPNLYLYNTIISKLSKARKTELSLELFAHMKAAGIEPSSVTYGAVINACCRVGDAQSAETLFNEMRSHRSFKPRVPPYNTMMQFFVSNAPSRAKVLHYHSLLRQDGVLPTAHTYKLLLDAYSTLPPIDLVAMERVYSDLLADRYVRPQGTHLASLITAYGIYGDDLAKAMEIFESPPLDPRQKEQAGSNGIYDAIVWEAILNVIAHRGIVADLEAMRQRMVATGLRPTAYVYNVLIAGYARGQRMDEARRIFDSMGDSVTGVAAPNNHPVLLTGSGYAKPQTTTEQPTGMVYREPSTYEAMIRAEMTAGDVARAQEVLGRMEARGYPFAVFMRVKAVVEDPSFAGLSNLHGTPPSV